MGHVDAMGVLNSQLHDGIATPTLRISVPIGTVVKCRRGTFIADLVHPGDEALFARGGQGGAIDFLEKEGIHWREENSGTLVIKVTNDAIFQPILLMIVTTPSLRKS